MNRVMHRAPLCTSPEEERSRRDATRTLRAIAEKTQRRASGELPLPTHGSSPLLHTQIDRSALVTCVQAGADIMDICLPCGDTSGPGLPVLTHFIYSGDAEAVKVCLESPNPIDFTIADASFRHSPLHALVETNTGSNEYNRDVLHAVVDRIARCPMDMVDWSQRDLSGRNFISLAAQNQLLSTVWPEVRDEVAYFADNTAGIPLEGELWEWDWQALGEAEQGNFNVEGANLVKADAATSRLWKLTESYRAEALQELKACVAAGATVTFFYHRDRGVRTPIFSRLLRRGEVAAVLACLDSPGPMDFTAANKLGESPLHLLAGLDTLSDDAVREILQAVIKRLREGREQTRDTVNWSQKTRGGLHCLSMAAAHQRLSLFWPIVQHEPAFVASPMIVLTDVVWEWDWAALGVEQQQRFRKDHTRFHRGSRSSAQLWQLLLRSPTDMAQLRRCLRDGADVMYKIDYFPCPILSACIWRGSLGVVAEMLQSPAPIDFSVVDHCQRTPLHYIPTVILVNRPPQAVAELVHLVLDRLEAHPEDTVDWSKKDNKGREPIAVAASCGVLSTWVQVVYHDRPVDYYVDHTGPIAIGAVDPLDWARLAAQDQRRFLLVGRAAMD